MTDCFSSMDMSGMSWMMWGAGLFWLLTLVLLVLTITALVKYLRSGRREKLAEPEPVTHPGAFS